MSWYRKDDGKIITDEEMHDKCVDCMSFCIVGTINLPCNRDSTNCPYYKVVDTSEYDKAIRAKAIDEFAERMKELSECGEISVFGWNRIVDEIAEQMKGGAIDG